MKTVRIPCLRHILLRSSLRSVDEKGRVVNPGEGCGLCGEVGRCGKSEISEDEERWRVESGMDKCVIVGKRRYKMCG